MSTEQDEEELAAQGAEEAAYLRMLMDRGKAGDARAGAQLRRELEHEMYYGQTGIGTKAPTQHIITWPTEKKATWTDLGPGAWKRRPK